MEKEQLKQVANDIENLGASLSGLTSTLLLADSCKRFEDESYRIWEILRKEV